MRLFPKRRRANKSRIRSLHRCLNQSQIAEIVKVILIILVLLAVFSCNKTNAPYPKRPKQAPYYYNETSITEMDQNAKISLRRARAKTGIEFVTVILDEIPADISIQNYAAGLFHEWSIGSKTNGKGVLLLFVENTQSLKIEVSYELEGIFTDAYCSSFQPTVKSYYAGRYFGDVFCGLVTCLERRILVGTDFDTKASLKGEAGNPERLKTSKAFLSGGGGLLDDEYYYDKDAKLAFIRGLPVDRIPEFNSHEDIEVVLTRYFQSLEEGINYPFLDLLTEGSAMRRLEYPESAHFYKCRWEDCRNSFPYRIKYKGDLATVRFAKPQCWPVFLRRTTNGFWKVDEARGWVSSWQDFAGNRSGPIHQDHPWMFAFQEYKYKKSLCNVPPLRSDFTSLKEEISRLEAAIINEPGNPTNYFKLADIFYWDCLWIAAAIDLTEKGLELQPDNVPYRWLAIFMRYRFPNPAPNIEHLEILLEIDPGDLDALLYHSQHNWYYTIDLKMAIKVLRRARDVEKNMTGDIKRFQKRIDSYKKNYWEQIEVDRSPFWRLWHYSCVFYSLDIILGCLAVALLLGLVGMIWIRRLKVVNKTRSDDMAL